MREIFLMIFSVIGFAVSFYIYRSKKNNTKLFCLIGENCDDVVTSKYGKTFGIENTIPGMMFYLLVFAYGLLTFLNQNIFKGSIIYYLVVSASIASVLFAIYLTSVQAFVLKKWCEWCITSSTISVLILITLLF